MTTVAKTTPMRVVRALRLRSPRSKYRNVKTEVDGLMFDSKAEAARYRELILLLLAGRITGLTLQPVYELLPSFVDSDGKRVRRITYVGDFFYYDDQINAVVEDVKGRETEVFRLKAKLFKQRYPGIKFVIVQA